jgi:hypothetical protein
MKKLTENSCNRPVVDRVLAPIVESGSNGMEHVNTFVLVELGRWLDSVNLSASSPMSSNIGAWRALDQYLNLLIAPGPNRFQLEESSPAGVALHIFIKDALRRHAADPSLQLNPDELTRFFGLWTSFLHALSLDLGRAPVYFATPKGIYSTQHLIRSATSALPAAVSNNLSERIRRDISEAGRCLAFNVPTASGFHAMRATEGMLREYYRALTGQDDLPRANKPPRALAHANMGQILDSLREQKAADKRTQKTLAVVDQIRDLHRNPIGHPEVFLESEDALELFNIAMSAISAMFRETRDRAAPVKSGTI